MSTKNTTTASSLIAELCGDESIATEVKNTIAKTKLVTILSEFRVRKGLTQKDIAEKMGASISKVSRIEASNDDDLRIGDVKDYMSAIGLNTSISFFDNSMSATEQIKQYVFAIERLLEHLTSLAKECGDDRSIVDGILRFRGEVLFNFLFKYAKSGEGFPILYSNTEEHSHATANESVNAVSTKKELVH